MFCSELLAYCILNSEKLFTNSAFKRYSDILIIKGADLYLIQLNEVF